MSAEARRLRVGIDIGGTFTDAVVMDQATGELFLVKVASTPTDPSEGFIEALGRAFAKHGVNPAQVIFTVHGTTVATNTIIEGKGARAGLVTSDGFRDVLEIAWQTRPSLYDVFFERPRPLIPRDLCLGVPERRRGDGVMEVPLDETAVRHAARTFRARGIEVIAIAFLHSYQNPESERRAAAIIAEEWPGVPVTLSAEICPEVGEYVRTSTTVVNAVLLPRVGAYIEEIERRLVDRGVTTGLHLMTSSGGIVAAETARGQPVQLIESGPAAGVIGAAFVGHLAGFEDLIALDIGGTTAKAALVERGAPRLANEFEVGAAAVATTTRNRGLGYPVKTAVIDLIEIGAGGGSIGHLDPGGALAVGPESAGAEPGPACYAKGGTEPTLTDANLVLGRLNPDYFLGGEAKLEVDLAREAIQQRLAERLGLSVPDAALGVVRIATAKMANALHLVSVGKGVDPRTLVLVACGGAGPLHAVSLARQLHIPTVVVPPHPGLCSALGLLLTDLRHDYVRAFRAETTSVDPSVMEETFEGMETAGGALLHREGVTAGDIRFVREVDMRYAGQSYSLRIPFPSVTATAATLDALTAAFFEAHERTYGFAVRNEPTVVVNLRLTAIGAVARPRLRQLPASGTPLAGAEKAPRGVYFAGSGLVPTRIYDRYRLEAGHRIDGPAIVEEMDSTTVVPPGASGTVDRVGNLVIATGSG